jgi:perosamine synthetase
VIPVNTPLFDGNEKRYLAECIDSGWLSGDGPFVTRFEEAFAESVGRRFGIAVSSGTAALDIAVEALEVRGLIAPTFTIISCLQQAHRRNVRPIWLIDSDPVTWNMDVEKLAERLKGGTPCDTIMIVHTYGLPVDMDPVMKLAQRYSLRVIEDAAQAHGLTYKGKPCGSFGDLSTFSFYSNKLVTCGEGGMIVTDNEDLAEECRSLRNLCFQPEKRFVHERLGWNYRMSNLQAAVGLAQLERLHAHKSRKRGMGHLYHHLLLHMGLDNIVQLPQRFVGADENMFWVYGLVLSERHKANARLVIDLLHDLGVQCRPFFCPMHKQPIFAGRFYGENYPVAERLYERGFYIPSGLGITHEQQRVVAKAVCEVLG